MIAVIKLCFSQWGLVSVGYFFKFSELMCSAFYPNIYIETMLIHCFRDLQVAFECCMIYPRLKFSSLALRVLISVYLGIIVFSRESVAETLAL